MKTGNGEIVLETEAALDDMFGPVQKVFEKPAKIDWSLIDPLSWPVCKTCGNRCAQILVDRGHECRACFIGRIDRVVRLLHPLRRELPDGRKLTLVA